MSEAIQNFDPRGQAKYIAPTTSSQRVQLTGYSDAPDLMFSNNTDKILFVERGNETVVAVAPTGGVSSTPLNPGAQMVLAKGNNSWIAVIAASAPSSGNFYVQEGVGS